MSDWLMILFFLLAQGSLAFLQKVAAGFYSWQTCLVLIWGVAFVGNMAFAIPGMRIQTLDWRLAIPLGAGVCATFSTVLLYRIIERTPMSVYTPVVSTALLVPVLLSYLVLHEPFSWKKALGTAFAVVAVFLMRV